MSTLNFLRLVYVFTRINLKIKYNNSRFGFIWSLINPVMMIVTTSIVFSGLLSINLYEYIITVSAAMVGWIFFNQVSFSSSIIFISYENIIRKINFTKVCLPISLVCTTLIDNLFFIFMVLSFHSFYGVNLNVLYFILSFALLILFAIGCSLYFSIINIYFRDFQWILTMAMQILFFLTPILYKPKFLNDSLLYNIVRYNPLTYMIGNISISLLGGTPPFIDIIISSVIAFLNLLMGYMLFKKYSGNIAQAL